MQAQVYISMMIDCRYTVKGYFSVSHVMYPFRIMLHVKNHTKLIEDAGAHITAANILVNKQKEKYSMRNCPSIKIGLVTSRLC